MTTKSQPNNQGRDEVYEWIKHLQKVPDDEEVQEKVVLAYTNLVESIARKYSKSGNIHEDLVQVGMIGLLAAVRRFDKSFNKSFESFAIPTIIGEIKRYIRDKTWSVHVPRRVKELGPKIKRAVDELTAAQQKSPTIKEIAAHLAASEEEILEAMEMGRSYKALSVDRKIEADQGGSKVSILDSLGNKESGYSATDLKLMLEKVFPILTEREQQILKYTFFDNLSQKETGELLGISQMHVSRLQRGSLKKLREAFQADSSEVID